MTRQPHLNAFLMGSGHHEAAWRLPDSDPFANLDLEHVIPILRKRSLFSTEYTGRTCGGPELRTARTLSLSQSR